MLTEYMGNGNLNQFLLQKGIQSKFDVADNILVSGKGNRSYLG